MEPKRIYSESCSKDLVAKPLEAAREFAMGSLG
jgi:hypothetical protein